MAGVRRDRGAGRAGLDGPLDYLRATALIDQITGRDSRPAPAGPAQDATGTGPDHGTDAPSQDDEADADWDDRGDWPGLDQWVLNESQYTSPGTGSEGRDGGGTRPPGQPGGPKGPPGSAGRGKKRRRNGTRIAARINLTIPLATHLEPGTAPGDAGPFGPWTPPPPATSPVPPPPTPAPGGA